VPDQQAEAEALEVNLKDLVTKEDLHVAFHDLESRIGSRIDDLESRLGGRMDALEAKMEGKLVLLQWMLGLLMGGVAALILKAFF
jgi:hypothetical protein